MTLIYRNWRGIKTRRQFASNRQLWTFTWRVFCLHRVAQGIVDANESFWQLWKDL